MTTHDMGKHLFVDDEEIHQTFGTWRVLNQPTKLPGPLITSGEPGRGGARGGGNGTRGAVSGVTCAGVAPGGRAA